MWIEEELQKDVVEIQRATQSLVTEYNAKSSRTIRSRITENKENTTGFLSHFYEALRNAEYQMYQQFARITLSSSSSSIANNEPSSTGSNLVYEFSEARAIGNSFSQTVSVSKSDFSPLTTAGFH